MNKYIGFLICLLLSTGLVLLSLISDTISCSRESGMCTFESQIRYLNIELNKENFPVEALSGTVCQKQVQPSRKGKQVYYVLKINVNENSYNISSYKKLAVCRADAKQIKEFIKDSRRNNLNVQSGTGFLNTFGIIFAFIILITGVIILRDNSTGNVDEEMGE